MTHLHDVLRCPLLWVLQEFMNQFRALSPLQLPLLINVRFALSNHALFRPGFNQAAAVFVPVDGLSNQLDTRKVGHVSDRFSAEQGQGRQRQSGTRSQYEDEL